MTIYCPFCGEKLVDEAKFCKNCGKEISDYKNQYDAPSDNYNYTPPAYENDHTLATVLGFACAILIPLFGIIFAIYLLTRDDSSKAKKYGIIILVLAILVWIISFIISFIMY